MNDHQEAPAEHHNDQPASHQPVLVDEILSVLLPTLSCRSFAQAKVYLDCTVGLGGHTEAILNAAPPETRVIAMDRDSDALQYAKKRLENYKNRVTFLHGSFKEMMKIAEDTNVSECAGILFDLGVSSLQLDSSARGFSFQQAGPLDMRMDQQRTLTAAQLVNTLREKELADIIYQYGEERGARKIAAWIVQLREKEGEITKTDQLANLICRAVRGKSKWTKTHPATKTFQALRIVVNDELGEIEAGMTTAASLLAVGGRLAVISFHSLEDRIVKQRFKAFALPSSTGIMPVLPLGMRRFASLYKKPVVPTPEEILQNPRARSAKLRVLERVA
ncbi:MAG: 16S rRNA (cytosine(1402)-N(4))-methyltransferase RsmH [Nitrospirota bacterium]